MGGFSFALGHDKNYGTRPPSFSPVPVQSYQRVRWRLQWQPSVRRWPRISWQPMTQVVLTANSPLESVNGSLSVLFAFIKIQARPGLPGSTVYIPDCIKLTLFASWQHQTWRTYCCLRFVLSQRF